MIKEKSCGCIIIENEKVLLVKHQKGHWDFPKGHIEKDETEIQTAIREVKEETNLDVLPNKDKRYTVQYKTDKGNMKEVVYFIAKKIGGEIKPQESEINKIEWVELEKAESKITYKTSKELIKKVLASIKYK